MQICMVGVGLMGHGIAKNILNSGKHSLSFLHHAGNQPVNGLLAAGAVEAQTLAEICPQADIILLCVTGAPEVEAILFEKGGVFDQARPARLCWIVQPACRAQPRLCKETGGQASALCGCRDDAHPERS